MNTSLDSAEFFSHILQKQKEAIEMPSNKDITDWVVAVLELLFPDQKTSIYGTAKDVANAFQRLESRLVELLRKSRVCDICNHTETARKLFLVIPDLYELMLTDASAILEGDPAAKTMHEVVRTYPGFHALSIFRIAHALHELGVPLLPRLITEYAHQITGIDIHPGAQIGSYLSIDHGTGLVIGETTIIGNHVKLYQGVTLGALSVEKDMQNVKRHPTIEDHVIVYSNATILGGDTIIGENCIIGGNVWITASVPADTTIYHQANTKIINQKAERI